jgi:hypothetical protein
MAQNELLTESVFIADARTDGGSDCDSLASCDNFADNGAPPLRY